MNLTVLLPFMKWFRLISKETLKADIIAGLTGAVIVLPQGVAFATIAGLPPQYGLYTAMVTPIIAALFGQGFDLVKGRGIIGLVYQYIGENKAFLGIG